MANIGFISLGCAKNQVDCERMMYRVQVGDTVIIIAYALMDFEEAKTFQPTVVFPKEGNKV